MKATYVAKRLLSCGILTLAIMGGTALAANTITKHNEEQKVEVSVEEPTKSTVVKSTYPTAGIVKQVGTSIRESGLSELEIQKHEVDIVKTAYENEEDTTNDLPVDKDKIIENAEAKNVQMQQEINHMEKTIDQYKKDNEDLEKKNKKLEKKLEEYEEKLKQQTKKPAKAVAKLNPSDVRVLSGATPETLNKLLEGTWLEGHGQKFYDNEQKYGVNALFSMGNAILETGWEGDNWLKKNKNNIYGLNTSRAFDSYSHCIDYWFELISEHYVGEGYISMSSIQKKYCPPNPGWDEEIISVANRLRKNAGVTNE